jgi:hypothetical protein
MGTAVDKAAIKDAVAELLAEQQSEQGPPEALTPDEYRSRYHLANAHLDEGTQRLDAALHLARREVSAQVRTMEERLRAEMDDRISKLDERRFFEVLMAACPQWQEINTCEPFQYFTRVLEQGARWNQLVQARQGLNGPAAAKVFTDFVAWYAQQAGVAGVAGVSTAPAPVVPANPMFTPTVEPPAAVTPPWNLPAGVGAVPPSLPDTTAGGATGKTFPLSVINKINALERAGQFPRNAEDVAFKREVMQAAQENRIYNDTGE